jgi:hypothetical protein
MLATAAISGPQYHVNTNATPHNYLNGPFKIGLRGCLEFVWIHRLVAYPHDPDGSVSVRVMGGVAAACFVAVSMLCGLDCAFAETAADGADSDHYLLFGGSDLWRSGGFLHGGVLASPGGLLHEGFTFKLLFGGGVFR